LEMGSKRIPLLNKLTVIGRNPNATVHVEDQSIAKEHCLIQLDDNFSSPVLM